MTSRGTNSTNLSWSTHAEHELMERGGRLPVHFCGGPEITPSPLGREVTFQRCHRHTHPRNAQTSQHQKCFLTQRFHDFFLHPYRMLIKLNGGKEGKGGVGTQEVSCFPSNSD